MRPARIAAFLILLLPAVLGAGEPAQVWRPLAVGNRWVYRVHRDYTFRPVGAEMQRDFSVGFRWEHVTGLHHARAGEIPTYRVLQTLRLFREDGAEEPMQQRHRDLSVEGSRMRLHRDQPLNQQGALTYDPPLLILPDPAVPGRRFEVGTLRQDDLEIEVRGEIVGIEDLVIGERRFESCLRVRYAGSFHGTLPRKDGRLVLRNGEFTRETWYQRGVGLVREITTFASDARLPDGTTGRNLDVETISLARYEVRD